MTNLVKSDKDVKLWPAEIRKMYHTYVCNEKVGEDLLPLEDKQRQTRQVERRVLSLSAKGAQMRSKCKTDIQRKEHENAQLVNDYNTLRKDRQSLQSTLKALQVRLQELEGGGASEPAGAIEDGATPSSKPATPPLAYGGSCGTPPLLPKVPSGGLPGPRQQSSTGSLRGVERRQQRTRSVPPLGAAVPTQARASLEDQRRMQSLLQTAELNKDHAEVQQLECTQLREHIARLSRSRQQRARPSTEGVDLRGPEEHIYAD